MSNPIKCISTNSTTSISSVSVISTTVLATTVSSTLTVTTTEMISKPIVTENSTISTAPIIETTPEKTVARKKKFRRESQEMSNLLKMLQRKNNELAQNPKSPALLWHAKQNSTDGKSVSNEPDEHDNVDWSWWGKLVNDFDMVAKTEPDELQQKIKNGIPPDLRKLVWPLLTRGRKTHQNEQQYHHYIQQSSPFEKEISRDLSRTFPKQTLFQHEHGKNRLFNLMKAYSIYDRSVGYCQGLGFVGGALLLHMPEEEAFAMLISLMEGYDMHDMYTPSMKGLQCCLYQFDKLLEDLLPKLNHHLKNQGVRSSMYASQWFLTLFLYKFPLDMVFRIMDLIFYEGKDIIFRFSFALLQKNEEKMLEMGFEQLLQHFNNCHLLYENNNIDEWVKDAYNIHIRPMSLERLKKEFESNSILTEDPMVIEMDRIRKRNEHMVDQNQNLSNRINTMTKENSVLLKENKKLKRQKKMLESSVTTLKAIILENANNDMRNRIPTGYGYKEILKQKMKKLKSDASNKEINDENNNIAEKGAINILKDIVSVLYQENKQLATTAEHIKCLHNAEIERSKQMEEIISKEREITNSEMKLSKNNSLSELDYLPETKISVVFQPGQIGIRIKGRIVTHVSKDGQAFNAGVRKGWYIESVNGEKQPNSTKAINQAIDKTRKIGKPTRLLFCAEQQQSQSQSMSRSSSLSSLSSAFRPNHIVSSISNSSRSNSSSSSNRQSTSNSSSSSSSSGSGNSKNSNRNINTSKNNSNNSSNSGSSSSSHISNSNGNDKSISKKISNSISNSISSRILDSINSNNSCINNNNKNNDKSSTKSNNIKSSSTISTTTAMKILITTPTTITKAEDVAIISPPSQSISTFLSSSSSTSILGESHTHACGECSKLEKLLVQAQVKTAKQEQLRIISDTRITSMQKKIEYLNEKVGMLEAAKPTSNKDIEESDASSNTVPFVKKGSMNNLKQRSHYLMNKLNEKKMQHKQKM